MQKKDKLLNFILPLLTVAIILLIWTVASISVGSKYLLPSVKMVALELWNLLGSSKFYLAFLLTLVRSLVAFSISFIIAGVFAFLSVKSKNAERVVLTVVSILRALPTLAIILLLLFWTNNQVAPIVVTLLVVLPTTYTHLKSAFDSVDLSVVEAGRVDGANTKQLFCRIELPQILPSVYSAIGSGISLNFKLMVAAEVLSATVKSLGNLLNIANYNGEIACMLAMVLFAVIFGIVVEFTFNKISKKASEWK